MALAGVFLSDDLMKQFADFATRPPSIVGKCSHFAQLFKVLHSPWNNTCDQDQSRLKIWFLVTTTKNIQFCNRSEFYWMYDSKLSTCHRSKTKLSSLLSLLKSSDFLLLLMLTLIISIISCWWITTSIGLDLPSAFNCIVLNRFHHKKIVLTILSAFTL